MWGENCKGLLRYRKYLREICQYLFWETNCIFVVVCYFFCWEDMNPSAQAAQDKWSAAFDACDVNNNGFIEPKELPRVFEKLNVKLDAQSQKNIVCLLCSCFHVLYHDSFTFIRFLSLIKTRMESSHVLSLS